MKKLMCLLAAAMIISFSPYTTSFNSAYADGGGGGGGSGGPYYSGGGCSAELYGSIAMLALSVAALAKKR